MLTRQNSNCLQVFAPHRMLTFSFATWTMPVTWENWTLPVSITMDWLDCMRLCARTKAEPFKEHPVFGIVKQFQSSVSTKSKPNWFGGTRKQFIWNRNSLHWVMVLCGPSQFPNSVSPMSMLLNWSKHSLAAKLFQKHHKNWNYGESPDQQALHVLWLMMMDFLFHFLSGWTPLKFPARNWGRTRARRP